MLHQSPEIRAHLLDRRSFAARTEIGQFEHRSATNELVIGGLAAVYESRSELLFGCFYEELATGAFRKALSRNPDVVCVFDHEGMPLARTSSGTLTLRDTPKGLEYEARMSADVEQARSLYAAIERGDVAQSSFSFRVGERGSDQWLYSEVDGYDLRRVLDVGDLYDVSPVGRPAYKNATVGARNLDVTTPDDDPAMDDSEVGSGEQPGGEGDGTQLPPDGPSDSTAGSEPGPTAAARSRALDLLRYGAHDVTARTAGNRD